VNPQFQAVWARSNAPTARLQSGHHRIELLSLVRATSATTSTTSCHKGQCNETEQHKLELRLCSHRIPSRNSRDAQHVNELGNDIGPGNLEHLNHLLSGVVDNQGDCRGHLIKNGLVEIANLLVQTMCCKRAHLQNVCSGVTI